MICAIPGTVHFCFSCFSFEKPSAIQQRAIVPCIKGYDVIAQAQSGTGKTATFSISILEQLDFQFFVDPAKEKPALQALVLAPTRELAQQVRKFEDIKSTHSVVHWLKRATKKRRIR